MNFAFTISLSAQYYQIVWLGMMDNIYYIFTITKLNKNIYIYFFCTTFHNLNFKISNYKIKSRQYHRVNNENKINVSK